MADHLTTAGDTSIAAMTPYFCWMSRHLLGCEEGAEPDDRLKLLAHEALCKFIEMPVLNAKGEPCGKPS